MVKIIYNQAEIQMSTDNNLTQKILGRGNQQAGNDINNIKIETLIVRESTIENILKDIYKIASKKISPKEPDTKPYTIIQKIGFNHLTIYKESYDTLMDMKDVIVRKIEVITETDPAAKEKIINYVTTFYENLYYSENKLSSNDIVIRLINNIKSELEQCAKHLSLDELHCIKYVVFFVFTECKIFKKPINE